MTEEPRWVERRVLEAVHADQLAEHGGRPGIRDEGLLESALEAWIRRHTRPIEP